MDMKRKRTKWHPTRDELIQTFAELSLRVKARGHPQRETNLVIDLCYARRDLQLALLGYSRGPPRPLDIRKHCEFGGMAGPVAEVVR